MEPSTFAGYPPGMRLQARRHAPNSASTKARGSAGDGKAVDGYAPVFLLGSHKSGSSLLRSLLDGHPELAVLPKETHLFQFTNHWVDYRRRRNLPRPLDRQQFFDSLLQQIRNNTSLYYSMYNGYVIFQDNPSKPKTNTPPVVKTSKPKAPAPKPKNKTRGECCCIYSLAEIKVSWS